MNILVLGNGGREHAIAWALAKSPSCDELYVTPGNGGTGAIAHNVGDLDPCDGNALVAFCAEHTIGLVVIGPEAPLVAGVADVLRAADVPVFGPDGQNAELEGSKAYCKRFMERVGIPTAAYDVFTSADPACAYIDKIGAPCVVKADGLAAGKGVVVAATVEEAKAAVTSCFEGKFGDAGSTVLIEECLTGPECSMLAFVVGGKAFCMPASQDHKRAFDGDKGPNTGGMGAYSPVPIVTDEEHAAMEAIMQKAAAATVPGAIDTGDDPRPAMDYRGVLYGGFMLTPQGPKVLEYNVRFGDPETEAVLMRFEGDLAQTMLAIAQGRVDDVKLVWSDSWAVDIVIASGGYPGSYEKGKVITGLDEASALDNVEVFHAGTKALPNGEIVTNGGRVLDVVALGSSFEEARDRAYQACEKISFEGKQMRSDIGLKALRGRAAWE